MAAECMIWLYAAIPMIYEVKYMVQEKDQFSSFQIVLESLLIVSTNQANVLGENETKHISVATE